MIKLFLAGLPGGGALVAIWSFLTSTIGIALIVGVVAYSTGYSHADRKADIAKLNAEIATLKADQTTSEQSRQLAERQTESLEAHLKSNQGKVDELEAELKRRSAVAAKIPGGKARDCGLSSDDLKRLRNIR